MKKDIIQNNQVTIIGKISSEFKFSHEVLGEGFYTFEVTSERISGICDQIPMLISERLIDVHEDYVGEYIEVTGQFRSFNKYDVDKNRLILYVFATEVSFIEDKIDWKKLNNIILNGYVCKKPIYRTTPYGREITDLLLAVNRPYGKSDYIPCIVWGRNARFVEQFEIGTNVLLKGRIQSRQYIKKLPDETKELRVAYEVSTISIEILTEKE